MQIDLCIDAVLWTETNLLFSAYLKTVENQWKYVENVLMEHSSSSFIKMILK